MFYRYQHTLINVYDYMFYRYQYALIDVYDYMFYRYRYALIVPCIMCFYVLLKHLFRDRCLVPCIKKTVRDRNLK